MALTAMIRGGRAMQGNAAALRSCDTLGMAMEMLCRDMRSKGKDVA